MGRVDGSFMRLWWFDISAEGIDQSFGGDIIGLWKLNAVDVAGANLSGLNQLLPHARQLFVNCNQALRASLDFGAEFQ